MNGMGELYSLHFTSLHRQTFSLYRSKLTKMLPAGIVIDLIL